MFFGQFILDQLEELRSQGEYADAYSLILSFISAFRNDGTFVPAPGVDPAVWTWFWGAEQVNRGTGGFSDFIRDYTSAQSEVRNGSPISNTQTLSDAIADSVLSGIIQSGNLPTLGDIATIDAAESVRPDFNGDESAWSGNLLFSVLGDISPYENNIIGDAGDTYDFFAMLESLSILGFDGIVAGIRELTNNLSVVLQAQGAGLVGFVNNAQTALTLRNLTTEYLREAYGEFFDNAGFVSFLSRNIEIDSVGSEATLNGGGNDDILIASDGDDTLIGSAGSDILDGGADIDTADYSNVSQMVTFEIGGQSNSPNMFTAEATVEGSEASGLFNIERIIGSNADDVFNILSLPEHIESIDGGEGEKDELNFEELDSAVTIDTGEGSISINGNSVEIENFEVFTGTDQDDTFNVTNLELENIDGSGGDRDTLNLSDLSEAFTGQFDFENIEIIIGSSQGDTIEVSGSEDADLIGGGGSDTLTGGSGGDTLYGGEENGGDDGVGDTLRGRGGDDTYHVENGDTINGSEDGSGDNIILNGTPLTGPMDEDDEEGDECPEDGPQEPSNPNGPWEGEDGATYSLSGSTLTVSLNGSTLTINNFKNGDYGFDIPEEEETDDGNGDADCNRDPLVIDLDGDGLEFIGQYDGAFYDYGNDGFADRTAWVGPDDGLIVRDLNGDGRITGDAELFNVGSGSLDTLASLDGNRDGVVDSNDSGFADLLVWQDSNTNGITDEGELNSLADIGIESLDVSQFGPGGASGTQGVTLFGTTTATLSDGGTALIGGVGFAFNDHITRYLGATEADADVADLPFLNGYGTTRDFDIAMTEDQTLQDMVEDLTNLQSADASEFVSRIEQIILRWHRVEDVVQDGRGAYVDGQHLAVVEDVFGNSFSNSDVFGTEGNPRVVAGSILTNSWNNYFSNTAARLFAQTDLGAELFPELGYYSAAILQVDEGTSVSTVLARMMAIAPEGTFEALAFWKGMALVLDAVRDQFTEQGEAFILAVNQVLDTAGLELTFDQLVETFVGLDGGDTLVGRAGDDPNGFSNDDVFISGTGDDTITDYGGEFTIIYGEGRGNDVFEAGFGLGAENTIRLVDLAPEDVSVTFTDAFGRSVVITILATGETLTLENIARDGVLRGPVVLSFEGGVNLDLSEDLSFDLPEATAGDDALTGSVIGDVLDGGAGNDTLDGGRGGDTYLIGPGNGSDTIQDSGFDSGTDVVRLDVNFADVTTDFNNGDFLIEFSSGEVLTVVGGENIESWQFLDQTFTGAEFTQMLFDTARTIFGTDGNDILEGTDLPDIINGGLGDDTLTGGNGDDEFFYSVGDGIDFIDNPGSGTDILNISGYTAADATITQDPDSSRVIIISFSETDQIRIDNYLSTNSFELENIVFDDGTEITKEDVRETLISAQITDGDDTVNGFSNTNDIIEAGLGNDVVDGGSGNDTYVFNIGDGNDEIIDSSGTDTLVINGYLSTDMIVSRAADNAFDLIISFEGSNDQILMRDVIENIEFSDAILTRQDLLDALLAEFNNNPDSLTYDGFSTDDVYEGGAGDDVINDTSGSDTFIFRAGDGNDTIGRNTDSNGPDRLILSEHNFEDVFFDIVSGSNDLLITFTDSPNDSIRVVDQIAAESPIFFDDSSVHTIEEIEFANGQVLDWTEIDDIIFQNLQTDGDDAIFGQADEQTLFLGNGNDTIGVGAAGNIFRPVDASGDDVLTLGIVVTETLVLEGLTPEDVTFARDGANLILRFEGPSSGTLTISGHFGNLARDINFIEFDDGTVFRQGDIGAVLTPVETIAEPITGTDMTETLTGTSLNERIDGFSGDDILTGAGGDDAYIYREGSGNDTIIENGGSDLFDADRVIFENLNLSDVEITRGNNGNNDLFVEILATGEVLTIQNQLISGNRGGANTIEQFVFEDGTTLNNNQIFSQSFIAGTDGNDTLTSDGDFDRLNGFDGNDLLEGNGGNDTLIGGLGDDRLEGEDGNDTYIYNAGDGNDTISERFGDGADTLIINGFNSTDVIFRVAPNSFGDDLLLELPDGSSILIEDQINVSTLVSGDIRINGDEIETIIFDDVELTRGEIVDLAQILGTDGNDNLSALSSNPFAVVGGLGDDIIEIESSAGPILWSQGDGNDTIFGITISDNSGAFQLVDVARIEAEFTRNGDDLILTVLPTNEIITFENYFIFDQSNFRFDQYNGPGQIEFTDITISRNEIYTDIPVGTSANDFIDGGARGDVINGSFGDDSIDGGTGDDILSGGIGRDDLDGEEGSDVFIWTLGDGDDTIRDDFDTNNESGEIDTLRLVGVTEDDFTFSRSFNDLIITFTSGESIRVPSQYSGFRNLEGMIEGSSILEQIELDDGTIISVPNFLSNDPITGTIQENLLRGDDNNNTLQGFEGADSLDGSQGADTYIWTVGDGNDIIRENVFLSTVEFVEGGDDIIETPDTDTLRLVGVDADDIAFARVSGEEQIFFEEDGFIDTFTGPTRLAVRISPAGETIFIEGQFIDDDRRDTRIEQILLDDGTIIELPDSNSDLPFIGTDGIDNLIGDNASTVFRGLEGDDFVSGDNGSDTFEWSLGDGNDSIFDFGNVTEVDTLVLLDVNRSDVIFSRQNDDLLVTISTTGEVILVGNQFGTPIVSTFTAVVRGNGIEQITFADGGIVTAAELVSEFGGVTVIAGDDSDNTLDSGTGNDLLVGGAGNDEYLFERGDGEDSIIDTGGEVDFINIGQGVSPELLVPQRDGNDLLLEIGGEDRLTLRIQNHFDSDGESRVEEFRFEDGTIITADDINRLILNAVSTGGDDIITGFDGSDIINAGGGDDIINAGGGDDVVDGGDGYDTLLLQGSESSFTIVTLDGVTTITSRFNDDVAITVSNIEAISYTNFSSNPNNFTTNILVENQAPITQDLFFVATEDVPLNILISDVLAASSDPDGGDVTLLSVQDPINGTIAVFDAIEGAFVFGELTEISNPFAEGITSGPGIINLTGGAVNFDISDSFTLTENSNIENSTINPHVTINGTGNFIAETYILDVDQIGSTIILDIDGADFDTEISIFDSNGNLLASNDDSDTSNGAGGSFSSSDSYIEYTTQQSGPFTIEIVESGFADILPGDNYTLNVSVAVGSSVASVDLDNFGLSPNLLFTPDDDFNGEASFTYTVIDGQGATSTGNVIVNVDAFNDAPVVDDRLSVSVDEDDQLNLTLTDLLAGISDVDDDGLSVFGITQVENGTAELTAAGITFTPDENFNGSASISYVVTDGNGGNATVTQVIDVTSINDAPIVISDIETLEVPAGLDSFFAAENFSDLFLDVEDNTITFVSAQNVINGTIDIDENDILIFSPDEGFSGLGSFDVTVTDGELEATTTISLSVLTENASPIVGDIDLGTTSEDMAIIFSDTDLLTNSTDVDNDELTVTDVNIDSAIGSVVDNEDGTYSFTPVPDFNGDNLEISFTVSDGALTSSAIATIDVIPVNDAPIEGAVLEDQSFAEDTAVSFALPADAFSDVDNAELALSATLADGLALPSWLGFDGTSFTGTPLADFNGDLDITVSASDGELSAQQSFTLAVTSVNDAPVAVGENGFELVEGETLAILIEDLLANDIDVDGDQITISSVQGAVGGSVAIVGEMAIFTPEAGALGPASFTYTISDGNGGEATASVDFTIIGSINSNVPTPNDDDLSGTQGADNIDALNGDDVIYGLGGNDSLIGGRGSDSLIGGAGNDVITTDEVDGGNDGNDQDIVVLGDVDNTSIGNDVITDFDTDNFRGGENNFDTLSFTFDGVEYNLAEGRDFVDFVRTIESDGDSSTDAIRDGNDLIFVFSRDENGVIIDSVTLEDVIGGDGITNGRLNNASIDELSDGDIFANVGDFEDNVLNGADSFDALFGEGGNDTLIGGRGSDILEGGTGDDILTGDAANGGNDRNDQDIFVFGDVDNTSIGNDVITDFDTNNFNGGENNFDTLSLLFGGETQELSTGSDIIAFAELLNTDADADTGAFRDGDDLVFVIQRDALGELLDSIRLEDVIGDDGITDSRLYDALVEDFEAELFMG